MNCSCEVTINRPIQQVWDYVNNPDNLTLWLNDFVRYEHVSGDMSNPKIGDTSKHVYVQNGKEFVMQEEIIAYNPPEHIKLFMTHKLFDMDIVNDFTAVGPDQTKLLATADTVRTSLLMKVIGLFMSNAKLQKDHESQIMKLKGLIEAS